jgi:hypothetical protein
MPVLGAKKNTLTYKHNVSATKKINDSTFNMNITGGAGLQSSMVKTPKGEIDS